MMNGVEWFQNSVFDLKMNRSHGNRHHSYGILHCSIAQNVHHTGLSVYMLLYHALGSNICARISSYDEKEPKKMYSEKRAIMIIMPFACMTSGKWNAST